MQYILPTLAIFLLNLVSALVMVFTMLTLAQYKKTPDSSYIPTALACIFAQVTFYATLWVIYTLS